MFNDVSREQLCAELLRHEELRPLARYVQATYPPGMVQLTSIEHEWRTLCTERGLAQGRPLSPALAARPRLKPRGPSS